MAGYVPRLLGKDTDADSCRLAKRVCYRGGVKETNNQVNSEKPMTTQTIYAGACRAGDSLETDKGETFYILNRDKHTASVLEGFVCFEQARECFRCGFMMPDGTMANGIGRCISRDMFMARARRGGWTVLEANGGAQ